jgi:hypothetical protein
MRIIAIYIVSAYPKSITNMNMKLSAAALVLTLSPLFAFAAT